MFRILLLSLFKSSAAKPAMDVTMDFALVLYNIGWMKSRLIDRHCHCHEKNLDNDLQEAIDQLHTDIVCLSECGTIGEGLGNE